MCMVCIYIYIERERETYIRIYTHMHVHVQLHMHIYIYIYTHTMCCYTYLEREREGGCRGWCVRFDPGGANFPRHFSFFPFLLPPFCSYFFTIPFCFVLTPGAPTSQLLRREGRGGRAREVDSSWCICLCMFVGLYAYRCLARVFYVILFC